jgi:hypothetical protein
VGSRPLCLRHASAGLDGPSLCRPLRAPSPRSFYVRRRRCVLRLLLSPPTPIPLNCDARTFATDNNDAQVAYPACVRPPLPLRCFLSEFFFWKKFLSDFDGEKPCGTLEQTSAGSDSSWRIVREERIPVRAMVVVRIKPFQTNRAGTNGRRRIWNLISLCVHVPLLRRNYGEKVLGGEDRNVAFAPLTGHVS